MAAVVSMPNGSPDVTIGANFAGSNVNVLALLSARQRWCGRS